MGENMKIVKLQGGLGNQMFQYAFAKTVERETGEEVKIDLTSYEKLNGDMIRKPRILNFRISLPVATKDDISQLCLFKHEGNSLTKAYSLKINVENILNRRYFFERNHSLCSPADMSKFNYFDGYWQDWAMVDSVMTELEEDFTPAGTISGKGRRKLEHINSTDSVFVGVRRGDYLSHISHFGTFGQKYYDDAMKIVADKVANPVFFVFSDDINWVRENLDFSAYNTVYITDTVDDFEDYVLMSNCKHSIMTNSTYHWWAARRNEYPGKIVVAPEKWFADDSPINIVPPRWIRVLNR